MSKRKDKIKVINLPFRSRLEITREAYVIHTDGSPTIGSTSLSTAFRLWFQTCGRRDFLDLEPELQELKTLTLKLETMEMHLLGRMGEILIQLTSEQRNELMEEIKGEIE